MYRIIVVAFIIIGLFSPFTGISCCAQDQYGSLTELLNDPIESRYPHHGARSIFTIKIDSTWNDLRNGYMNSGIVKKVYRGKLNAGERIKVGSGGNTSAGGKRLRAGAEYVIFSRPNASNIFYAFVCDGFSTTINYNNKSSNTKSGKEYLKVIDEYFQLKNSKYSGKKTFTLNGKTLAKGKFKNGLPHGKWKHYNVRREKKSLVCVNNYDNGILHGEEKNYKGYGKKQLREIKKFDQGKVIEKINYSSNEDNLFISTITSISYLKNNYKQQSITEYYAADQIRRSYNNVFTNVKTDSRYYPYQYLTGKYIAYHENGQVKEKGEYYRGAKVYEWYTFKENGTLEMKKHYKKPNQNNAFVIYHQEGFPQVIGNIENGSKEGQWKFFTREGKLYQIKNFQNDIAQGKSQSFWAKEGTLMREEFFENGKLHGESNTFHKDGKTLSNITIYKHGKKEGFQKTFFEDGTVSDSSFYKNDTLQGEQIRFHSPFVLKSKQVYKNGLLHGVSELYHKNGILASKGTYQTGTMVGTWKNYYDTGVLRGECKYPLQPQEVNQFHPQPLSCINYEKDGSLKKPKKRSLKKRQWN